MNGKNILIIEDNLHDAELLRRVVEEQGYHVEHAKSASDAQRILRHSSHFRFACVDLKVPDMDGVELVRWLKDNYTHIPVAIISGYSDERKKAQVMDCGAVFLFPKPFTSNDMRYMLNFMDVTEAIFKKGANLRPSWRTTLGGMIVSALGVWSCTKHVDSTSIAVVAAGVSLAFCMDERAMKALLKKKS
jgi:CheY-like chemotaxis protein